MSSFGTLPTIDGAVQIGRGVAASVLGQTYNVYRLGPSTNNSVISGSPVHTAFPAMLDRAKKTEIENVAFDLLAFAFTCDNRQLVLGDVLVETGYESNGGQYVYAQERPLKPSLFVRAERNVTITRPNPYAGSAGSQPSSGSVLATDYIGTSQNVELFLTLTNGLYNFGTTGTMAAVPLGLQPTNKVRGTHKPAFPTQVDQTTYLGYLPMLPGVQILENDIINSDSGDRYLTVQPYQSDQVGLNGYILILHKIAV